MDLRKTRRTKSLERISVQRLKGLHAFQQEAIRNRLQEFSRVQQSEYFYELVYCLLTPQSSAVNADKVITLLRDLNFKNKDFNPEPILRKKDNYIRFHRTKSKHLLLAKEQFSNIENQLISSSSVSELREWLVKNVKGLGWKESSHFLRNIGYKNLAILDRHILKCLVRVGVLKKLPQTLTVKTYKTIEKKFLIFSDEVGISIDELDLLFWSMATGEILK